MNKKCCESLIDIDWGVVDYSNIKNITDLYDGCHNLSNINLDDFNDDVIDVETELNKMLMADPFNKDIQNVMIYYNKTKK